MNSRTTRYDGFELKIIISIRFTSAEHSFQGCVTFLLYQLAERFDR